MVTLILTETHLMFAAQHTASLPGQNYTRQRSVMSIARWWCRTFITNWTERCCCVIVFAKVANILSGCSSEQELLLDIIDPEAAHGFASSTQFLAGVIFDDIGGILIIARVGLCNMVRAAEHY